MRNILNSEARLNFAACDAVRGSGCLARPGLVGRAVAGARQSSPGQFLLGVPTVALLAMWGLTASQRCIYYDAQHRPPHTVLLLPVPTSWQCRQLDKAGQEIASPAWTQTCACLTFKHHHPTPTHYHCHHISQGPDNSFHAKLSEQKFTQIKLPHKHPISFCRITLAENW